MAKWDLSKLPEGRKPLTDEWFREKAQMQERIAELEAKLAKALDVDLIEQAISDVLSEGGTYRDAAEYVARTTLAELKGEDRG